MTTSEGQRARGATRVLTISATYGAGGAVAAPLLARRLGLPFADRLINPRGTTVGSEEQITQQELDDQPRSSLLDGLLLLGTAWSSVPATLDAQDSPERLRAAVETSIATFLDTGGAVILGRAAAAVIGRRAGAFHVRLDGPPERRARRGATWEGIGVDVARAHLTKTDVARARYVQRLYGRDPADAKLYHLVLDSTVISLDALVELVAAAAEAAWGYDDSKLQSDIDTMRDKLTQSPA
jgi:cytidylate kinase